MCLRKLPRLRGVPEQPSTQVEDGVATVLQFHHVLRLDVEAHGEQAIVPGDTEATDVAPEVRVLVETPNGVVPLLQEEEVLIPLRPSIATEEAGEEHNKQDNAVGTHGNLRDARYAEVAGSLIPHKGSFVNTIHIKTCSTSTFDIY